LLDNPQSREPQLGPATGQVTTSYANWRDWSGIAWVLALTFAVYSPALRYDFVHDDWGQIVQNPAVHSWRAVPHYFTSHVWEGFMPEERTNYFRPLFLLWLRINDALFGNRAWAWHLTTILSHLAATYLVWLLASRMGLSRGVAVLAALVFGVHPVHIEAVAWISGVTEPLLGVLLLGSLLCHISAQRKGESALRLQVISVAVFALAILEKETAVILPVFLLIHDWIHGQGSDQLFRMNTTLAWCGRAIRRTWGHFLILLLYVPLRIHALKQFSYAITPISVRVLFQTWPSLIWFWIRHLVYPVGLYTFYDFPVVTRATLRNCAFPAIMSLVAAAALVLIARRSRASAFFASWLVIPLIPLFNLRVFSSSDFAHDRYLYLPSLGLAVLVAMALESVCRGTPRAWGLPASFLVFAAGLALALSYGTLKQSCCFKDNLTFYAYNYKRSPHNRIVETNYASTLGERGDYDRALEILTDVMTRNPDYWSAAYNLAYTDYRMGRLPEAEKQFLEAIPLAPSKPDQYLYLGLTRFKMGRTADAIPALEQAIRIRPTGYGYHFSLGMMLKAQGDLSGALREMQVELSNYPAERAAAEQAREVEKEIQRSPHA